MCPSNGRENVPFCTHKRRLLHGRPIYPTYERPAGGPPALYAPRLSPHPAVYPPPPERRCLLSLGQRGGHRRGKVAAGKARRRLGESRLSAPDHRGLRPHGVHASGRQPVRVRPAHLCPQRHRGHSSRQAQRLRHRDGDEHQGPLRADRYGVRRLPQAHRGHGRGPCRHFSQRAGKARRHAYALPPHSAAHSDEHFPCDGLF